MKSLVLGATSAIAAEVAARWAARGDTLLLIGRNAEKLDAVQRRCGDNATTVRADFASLDDNARIIEGAIEALGTIDRVLIAHGELGDQLRTERDPHYAEHILRANFGSVVSLLVPLANQLERQRRGKLGVITSVAGDRGRPRNYTYGAAKAALNTYLQGMRTRLYPSGVAVTTLKVGPVDTPMTVGHKKHPLFGKPPAVAAAISAAIESGTPEAYVPGYWALIMPLVRSTPEIVFQRLPFLSGR